MKRFKLHFIKVILAIFLFAINITIILQLIPVFESDSLNSKIIKLVVSPPIFIFEDLLGITSVEIINILIWILQFGYVYLIIHFLFILKGGKK